jgi:hypothetical protein
MRGMKYVWVLFTLASLANFSFGQSGAGTLAETTTSNTTSGDCTLRETNYAWTFTDSLGAVHSFPTSTNTHVFETCSTSCNPTHEKSGCFTGCGCPETGTTTQNEWSTDSQYYLQATGASGVVSTLFDPKYKVVSVIYSPPGNESSQGYSTSTTDGTTTTVGSSFSFSETLTFSSGIPNIITGSASTGFSVTSSNSSAFTQTWMDATSVVTDDNSNSTYNPSKSNAVNHNLDTFAIWLNPRVSVIPESTSSTTPVSYTVGSQYTPGVSAIVADIILLPAITMEATPAGTSGVTTVPVAYLVPQAIAGEDGVNSYMPGLGAICKNNSLYVEQAASSSPSTPTYCTQSNQCGCTPSDFVNILQRDPLLNYNGTTLTASPYAGTVSPLTLDASGVSVCAENPVPTSANCRYVVVPIDKGSPTPLFEPLSGSEGVTYTVSDSTSTTETLGASASNSLGVSVSSGPIFATLTVADTWTWTDNESIGSSTGTGNSMSVTLETSTAACDENVDIYEDTLYHTYAFQIPTGITTCP